MTRWPLCFFDNQKSHQRQGSLISYRCLWYYLRQKKHKYLTNTKISAAPSNSIIVRFWQKCIFIWLHSKICYCLQLSQCFRNWLYLFCLVRWLYIWSLESPLWNYSVSHCDLTNFFCSFFRAKAAHQQFAWRHEGRSLDYLPTTQQQQV